MARDSARNSRKMSTHVGGVMGEFKRSSPKKSSFKKGEREENGDLLPPKMLQTPHDDETLEMLKHIVPEYFFPTPTEQDTESLNVSRH